MPPRRNQDSPSPTPLSRQRVCPFPPEPKGGGGEHTCLRLRGWGSPNSDDWRKAQHSAYSVCKRDSVARFSRKIFFFQFPCTRISLIFVFFSINGIYCQERPNSQSLTRGIKSTTTRVVVPARQATQSGTENLATVCSPSLSMFQVSYRLKPNFQRFL